MPYRRLLNIVLVVVMIVGAALVYRVKYGAQLETKRIQALEAQIKAEREEIAILKAEWSLLNQPNRLQSLTEQYADILQLRPLKVEQIASLDDVLVKSLELETGEIIEP